MITLGGVVIGLLLLGIGFLMIWKTHSWRDNVGSLNIILGYPRLGWLDWNSLGVFLMVTGLLVGLGLVQDFLTLTIGRLFQLSNVH